MKRFTKRCDFNDILHCRHLIDGEEEDCEYRTERGYCANLRFYFSDKERYDFEEGYDFEMPADALLAVTLIEELAFYEWDAERQEAGCAFCKEEEQWEFDGTTFAVLDGIPMFIPRGRRIGMELSDLMQYCPKCGRKLTMDDED